MTDEPRPAAGDVNYGIQVGPGGSFNANAVAVGPRAHARSEGPGPSPLSDPALLSELRIQVERLLAELRAHVDRGDDVGDALAAVEEGAAELAKGEPDGPVVVGAFKRAAAGIASLGAVAGNVQAILQLLGIR